MSGTTQSEKGIAVSLFPTLSTYVPTTVAAKILGVTPDTMRRWRQRGDGPPFIRVGPTLCRYSVEALRAWLDARTGARSEVE